MITLRKSDEKSVRSHHKKRRIKDENKNRATEINAKKRRGRDIHIDTSSEG